jgi:hypothetical protein
MDARLFYGLILPHLSDCMSGICSTPFPPFASALTLVRGVLRAQFGHHVFSRNGETMRAVHLDAVKPSNSNRVTRS